MGELSKELLERIKKEQGMIDESFEDGFMVDDTPCLKCQKTPSIDLGGNHLCQEHAHLLVRNKRIFEALGEVSK